METDLDEDFQKLPLNELIAAVRREATLFRQGQSVAGNNGYELMRRAIHERDDAAWAAVIEIYRGQVLAWCRRHPAWPLVSHAGDDDDWVYTVFGRFAGAMRPEQFATFANLSALLHYVKMCAFCAVLDAQREAQRMAATIPLVADGSGPEPSLLSDPASAMINRQQATELWAIVLATTKNEAERVYARLHFKEGYLPREIQQRYPALFPTPADIYRVGRNLTDRLRRDPALRRYLGDGTAKAA